MEKKPATRLRNKNHPHDPASEKTAGKNTEWKFELLALSGFSLSGLFFIVSSIRNGDVLSLIGSVVWVVSCLFWMLPYKKHFSKESACRSGKRN